MPSFVDWISSGNEEVTVSIGVQHWVACIAESFGLVADRKKKNGEENAFDLR